MVHDTDECEARGGVVEVSRQYARGVVSEHVVRQRDLGQRRVIGERVGQKRQPRVVDATAVQLEPAQQRTRRHELGQPRAVLRSRYTTRTYTSVSQQHDKYRRSQMDPRDALPRVPFRLAAWRSGQRSSSHERS